MPCFALFDESEIRIARTVQQYLFLNGQRNSQPRVGVVPPFGIKAIANSITKLSICQDPACSREAGHIGLPGVLMYARASQEDFPPVWTYIESPQPPAAFECNPPPSSPNPDVSVESPPTESHCNKPLTGMLLLDHVDNTGWIGVGTSDMGIPAPGRIQFTAWTLTDVVALPDTRIRAAVDSIVQLTHAAGGRGLEYDTTVVRLDNPGSLGMDSGIFACFIAACLAEDLLAGWDDRLENMCKLWVDRCRDDLQMRQVLWDVLQQVCCYTI